MSSEGNTVGIRNQNGEWICSHESEGGSAVFLPVEFGYIHSSVSGLWPRNAGEGARATRLGLLRDANSQPVNCFQDRIAAALKQGLANGFSKLNRIGAVTGFSQNFGAIGIGDDCFEVQAAIADFGECADGHLAASAKFVEQRSLTSGSGASRSIVEEG